MYHITFAWVAGTPGEGKRKIWVIARQHPGESMAEWFMQVCSISLIGLDGLHAFVESQQRRQN